MKLFLCTSIIGLTSLFVSCAPNTAATKPIPATNSSVPSPTTNSSVPPTVTAEAVPESILVVSESFDQIQMSSFNAQWRTNVGDVLRTGTFFDGPGQARLSISTPDFEGATGRALSLEYSLLLCSGTNPKINRKNGCERHADAIMDFTKDQQTNMTSLPVVTAKVKLKNAVVNLKDDGTYDKENLQPLEDSAYFVLEAIDAKGNVLQYKLQTPKKEWENIEVDLGKPPTSRIGNTNKAILPLRSISIVLKQPAVPDFDQAVGYLLIDDIAVKSPVVNSSNTEPVEKPIIAITPITNPLNATGILEIVRFGDSNRTTIQGGNINKSQYSQRPGDSVVQSLSTKDGVLTIDYSLSRLAGSNWGGAGTIITMLPGIQTVNAQGFNTIGLQLASVQSRFLTITIAGNEEKVLNSGCYPVFEIEITPELKNYSIPVTAFAPSGFCDGQETRSITETMKAGVHYVSVVDTILPTNGVYRGQMKVGAIRFVR